jgi:PAS domain S-box-containing protein
MRYIILSYKLDFIIFFLLAIGGAALIHFSLRKFKGMPGFSKPAWLIILAFSSLAFVLSERSGKDQSLNLQKMIQGFAFTYAQELELMGHSKIQLNTPPEDPLYLKMISAQIRWQKANPLVNDIYTFRKKEDGAVALLVDSETDYDRDGKIEGDQESRTDIGEEYSEVDPLLEQAFEGLASFYDVPVKDRWGIWVSAYVPMRDTEGRVESVLGVDYDANEWIQSILWRRLTLLLLMAVVIIIFFFSWTVNKLQKVEIDERKKIESALRQSETLFRTLASNAPVGIYLTNEKNQCVYVNPKWCQMSGLSLHQARREGWTQTIHPDDRKLVLIEWEEASLSRHLFSSEHRFQTPQGKTTWISNIAVPLLDDQGQSKGYIGTLTDITARKIAELKIQEVANFKAEFTAVVSHELRTPMTVIKESIALLEDGSTGPLNDEQKDFLETTKRNVDRLTRLVNSVLEYQKLEAGAMEFRMEVCDLNQIILEIKPDFIILAERKKLVFETMLETGLPPVSIDKDKIIQVLINFVNNAIKFTEKGKITLRTQKEENNYIRVSIQDEGIGIRDANMMKLFKSFSQIPSEDKVRRGGTGLGLAISKKIVEKHRGYVGVESVFGKGSTFYFILPRYIGE